MNDLLEGVCVRVKHLHTLEKLYSPTRARVRASTTTLMADGAVILCSHREPFKENLLLTQPYHDQLGCQVNPDICHGGS